MKKFLLIILFIFLSTSRSYAYLDPGTFTIIINFFIALIAGISTYLILFWEKIKNLFSKKNKKKNENEKKS